MPTKSKRLDPIEKQRRADERARVRDLRRSEKKARHLVEVAQRRAAKRANSAGGCFERAAVPWQEAHLAVYAKDGGREVGPSEFSAAAALGLELVVGHRSHRNDLPNGVEVKSIQGQKDQLIPFRAGADAIRKYMRVVANCGRWVQKRVDEADKRKDTSVLYALGHALDYVVEGLKSNWRNDLPPDLVELVDDALRPSVGLSEYDKGIILTTRFGWIFVGADEYDEAFALCAVSKACPKYAVRKDWLARLPSYSPSQSQPEKEDDGRKEAS